MRKILLAAFVLSSLFTFAQQPGGGRMGGGGNFNVGHFYGKVVDSKSGKGLEGITVQLFGNKTRFDSATKKNVPIAIKAEITASNGDFSLEDLPVMGNFTLRLSAIGYKQVDQKISFGLKMPSGGGGMEGGRDQMMSMVDKDLGNIKLETTSTKLEDVTVTATKPLIEMGIDRKIFNVDKNLTSTGQTAVEVMRNIPTLSVDIDGNVTMRNASPQLFIDNRPTTMTLDQIPADIIDRVELITNPSAKFDASGGNAGILNIVLKKNKRTGYNGGLRAGIDTRGKFNGGGDFNLRQGKINFFAAGNYNQRKSISTSFTDRTNLDSGVAYSRFLQTGNPLNEGSFKFIRTGFDYLIDNRNTVSFTGNFGRGTFTNTDHQNINYVDSPFYSVVNQGSTGLFKNTGTQLSYKHLFAKAGHEWSFDGNYNYSKNENNNTTNSYFYGSPFAFAGFPDLRKSSSEGFTKNYTFQTDYTNPLSDNKKIEAGVRAAIRQFSNQNDQSVVDPFSKQYRLDNRLSSMYTYTDRVYAAYTTYSFKVNKWSFQLGLRAESSNYDGTLNKRDSTGTMKAQNFKVDFPFAFFPSAFATYKLSDKEDLQLNYTRRINRPNFFQLIPFPDFSDPYNISIGNAGLKPEFTNSLELSYNNTYKRGANFLVSGFFKYNTNLITRYQYGDSTSLVDTSRIGRVFTTYINADNSVTYGVELTNRVPVTKWWDNTLNFNIFNSQINVDDPKLASLSNQRTSWFAKINNSFKFWKTWSVQLSGEYYAKTVLPQEGGRGGGGGGFRGGGGGGGMMFGGGNLGTSQGYIGSRYSFDIAIRKDWTWKGGNSASINLSMNDFLRTNLYKTHTESGILIQDSERRRDPQVARLNFTYRFGKFDINLFKRKSTKDMGAGMDMIPMQ